MGGDAVAPYLSAVHGRTPRIVGRNVAADHAECVDEVFQAAALSGVGTGLVASVGDVGEVLGEGMGAELERTDDHDQHDDHGASAHVE